MKNIDILFRNDVSDEIKIIHIISLIHENKIGINKAFELLEECKILKKSKIELEDELINIIENSKPIIVTKEMIDEIRCECFYILDFMSNEEIEIIAIQHNGDIQKTLFYINKVLFKGITGVEKQHIEWIYEIGEEVPERMGSGSDYYRTSTRRTLKYALIDYKNHMCNYLYRWRYENKQKIIQYYNFSENEFIEE